jgi:Zn-dependent M28 family amino/carboxypeptidase
MTGEENGLLGSSYYTRTPALPLEQAVAGATLDMTAGHGKGADLVLFGKGLSELDSYFERAAAQQGRRLVAPRPEDANYFERSDNLSFVRKGVPVLTASGLWAEGPSRADFDAFEDRHYHKPSDEFANIKSFEGAAEDAELLYEFGRALAASNDWPEWREGTPYRALRKPRN